LQKGFKDITHFHETSLGIIFIIIDGIVTSGVFFALAFVLRGGKAGLFAFEDPHWQRQAAAAVNHKVNKVDDEFEDEGDMVVVVFPKELINLI